MTTNQEFKGYRGRGLPGSVHCRMDFGIEAQAFSNVKLDRKTKRRKDDVVKFKKRAQLGDKPSWNNSVERKWVNPTQMRQLSKYQSIKIPYDFRDLEISEVYKNQIFIPKSGKYEIDPYPFLDEKQKKKATRENIIVHRERDKEMETLQTFKSKPHPSPFNISTQFLDRDMTKGYENQRNKTMRATKKKGNQIFSGKKKRVSLINQYKRNRREEREKKIEKRRFDELQASIRGRKHSKDKERPRFITRV